MGLGLLFPGQGSQGAGMFDGWAAEATSIVAALHRAIGGSPDALAPDDLYRNAIAQPLIVAYELALHAVLRPLLPAPVLVLGYSVGEIAAASAAGMLGAEEAVALAARRAAIMDQVGTPGFGLLAIRGLPLARLRRIAEDSATEVAIENGRDHAVLGGHSAGLTAAAAAAQAAGAHTVRRLAVSISSHTSDLAAAAEPFRQELERTLRHDPVVTLVSGVSASPLYRRTSVIDDLTRQLHDCLHFADALTMAKECGATCFLEIGAGHALTQMVTDLLPDVPVRPIEAFRTPQGIAAWVERSR